MHHMKYPNLSVLLKIMTKFEIRIQASLEEKGAKRASKVDAKTSAAQMKKLQLHFRLVHTTNLHLFIACSALLLSLNSSGHYQVVSVCSSAAQVSLSPWSIR
jgi:hypothetical protein